MAKRAIGPLSGDGIRLRLLEEADLPSTLAWRNQDSIRRWFLDSSIIAPAQHQAWWSQYRDRDDDLVFVIDDTAALRRPVGQVSLYRIDWADARAEFGRLMIGDLEARGRGLGRRATERLLDEAFGPLNLREVHLQVREDNAPALAIYAACGFTESRREGGVMTLQRFKR